MKPGLREVVGAAKALLHLQPQPATYDSRIEPGCGHRKLSAEGAAALGFRLWVGPSSIRRRGGQWLSRGWTLERPAGAVGRP